MWRQGLNKNSSKRRKSARRCIFQGFILRFRWFGSHLPRAGAGRHIELPQGGNYLTQIRRFKTQHLSFPVDVPRRTVVLGKAVTERARNILGDVAALLGERAKNGSCDSLL